MSYANFARFNSGQSDNAECKCNSHNQTSLACSADGQTTLPVTVMQPVAGGASTTISSRKKLVVLYLITKSELGGAQTHVLNLIQGFVRDYEIHLATSVHGPLTEAAGRMGAGIHLLPSLGRSIHPLKDIASLSQSTSLIRDLQPDLIHAHSSKAGLVGRVCGRVLGVPVVFTAHGWGFTPGTPFLQRAIAWSGEKVTAPLARRIICVSEFDRQLALRHLSPARQAVMTVHNGIAESSDEVPDEAPQVAADDAETAPRFAMVARFSRQKDHATLLRAVALMKEDNFHLDLIGSGPLLAACQQLAKTLDIEDKVSFWGDSYDVPIHLSKADGFVLSTNYEGFPISILEAMRAGLPVIATNVSGIAEAVEHNRTGLLVPPHDEEALASALKVLVETPLLRRQMGYDGRQKFLREFTLQKMLAETQTVYRQVLATAHPPQ